MATARTMKDRAVEAFAAELEAMPLETLVEVVDLTTDARNRALDRRLAGPRRADWLERWLSSSVSEAASAAGLELAYRAGDIRASLVERLAAALEAGDVEAFADIARDWRALPAPIKDFLRAWNGVDVPFFDPLRGDIEPEEFVPSAVRRRVVEALRSGEEGRANG